ncbi:MAG: iron-sulfur cluster repair di-iron protein [Acidobacteria bacterium]|nr:iron-sulfur cluster repair di-iron protein [Acidobacteriota bacterium]
MTIAPSIHVADIVAEAPGTIAVFQRHQIEFCCGGHVPLELVCENEGLDVDALIQELEAATRPFAETEDWDHATLTDLVAHIQATYHDPLYQELPRLRAMLAKVVQRHGDVMPETLRPLQATFAELERDLTLHMRKEDAVLFPAIVRFESTPGLAITGPHPLVGPIAVMEHDHDHAGDALAAIRTLTGGYEPPEGACPTFRGLYHGLSELEHRMHLHVHLENDILFPRALRLGRTTEASETGRP